MRWSRIAIFTLLLASIAAIVLLALPALHWVEGAIRAEAQAPNPVVASPSETREILEAVLQKAQFVGIPPPPPEPGEPDHPEPRRTLLLSDRSVCFAQDPERRCSSAITDSLGDPELETFAPLKLRQELLIANRVSTQLQLSSLAHTKVVASSEVERVFSADGWEYFYEKYPKTAGYAEIAQPVLSENRQQALIYVAHHCDGLCGTGTVYLLTRVGARWYVSKQEMLWIS